LKASGKDVALESHVNFYRLNHDLRVTLVVDSMVARSWALFE